MSLSLGEWWGWVDGERDCEKDCPMSLSANDLARLKALCDAATPGPWHTVRGVDANDSAFIAASRTAVPQLIAEVERLTEDRDGWKDLAIKIEADAQVNEVRAEKAEALLRDFVDCTNSGHYEAICEAEAKARAHLAEQEPKP